MEYKISGRVKFTVNFKLEASSEGEAFEKAHEKINDLYNLDAKGSIHNVDSVDMDLYADECEEEV